MENKIIFAPEALQDLNDIGDYISEELSSPQAAKKLLSEILSSIELLGANPLMGASISALTNIVSDYRYLVVKNYLVLYRVSNSLIYIDRILYSRRNYLSVLFDNS